MDESLLLHLLLRQVHGNPFVGAGLHVNGRCNCGFERAHRRVSESTRVVQIVLTFNLAQRLNRLLLHIEDGHVLADEVLELVTESLLHSQLVLQIGDVSTQLAVLPIQTGDFLLKLSLLTFKSLN